MRTPQSVHPIADASDGASLEEQLAFERMLGEIATRIASIAPVEVEAEIAAAIRRLIAAIDRSQLPPVFRIHTLAACDGIEAVAAARGGSIDR